MQNFDYAVGYFIPEFPGQTHAFFWREKTEIEKLGFSLDIISTRRPSKKLLSHTWASTAVQKTYYLFPPSIVDFFGGLLLLIKKINRWSLLKHAFIQSDTLGWRAKFSLFAYVLIGAQLAYVAQRKKWKHIHVHSCGHSANIALFCFLISNVPYSLTLHGPISDYGSNQKQKWHNAAFAIVITQKLFNEVHEQLKGFLPPAIFIAPMGVDINHFKRIAPYIPWQKGQKCKLFTCGRLNPCKGHEDIIRAVAILHSKGIEADLRIAGEVDIPSSDYRSKLESLIHELSLQSYVKLLGAVSEDVVKNEIEQSHVFALASLQEPLGVAIMEAMSMETPIVATRTGGVKELVEDGVDGSLVSPQNPQDIADAIEKVVNNPTLTLKRIKAAREKIIEKFNSKVSATVIASNLKSIVLNL